MPERTHARAEFHRRIAETVHRVDCGCPNPDGHTPDSLDYYQRVSGAVMELFDEVEVAREYHGPGYVIGANGPAFGDLATHSRYVLRTAPEPIKDTHPKEPSDG